MEVRGIFLVLFILYADCSISNALQVRTDVRVVTSIWSDAKLWCNLTDDSDVISHVLWKHKTDPLVTCYNTCVTANYSVTINRNEATSALIIPSVQQEDGGPYWCKMSTGSESATKSVTLVVNEPPKQPVLTWSKKEPLSESSSDNSLNITCQSSTTYGSPYVVWKKENVIVSEVAQRGCATLHFAVLTRNASGLYTCEVDNGFPPSGKTVADINVHYPPEILKNVTWLTAVDAYRTFIHCIIDANPPPFAINWTSNNDVYEERQWVTNVFKTKYQSLVRSTLEISVKYRGTLCQNYTCSVMNIAGRDNHTIEVCAEDPPDIVKNVSNMIANDVTYTTIDCIIDTNLSPLTINWTASGGGYSGNHRETEMFKSENRLVLRSTLEITVASMNRKCENYTCSATNMGGKDNHTIHLCKSASPGHHTSLCKTLRCPFSIPGVLLVLGFILLAGCMCWLTRRHTVNQHKTQEKRKTFERRRSCRHPKNSNRSILVENGKDAQTTRDTQVASDSFNLQSSPIGIYQCDAVFDDEGDLYATTIKRMRGRCMSSEHSTTDDTAVDERSCSTDTPYSDVIPPYSPSYSMKTRNRVREELYDNPVSYKQTNTYTEAYPRSHMYFSLEGENMAYNDVVSPIYPSQVAEYACIKEDINDNPFYSCREL